MQVVIEITTKCNFHCDYCYTKNFEDKMMSFDLFKSIIDEWSTHPPVTISLSGEGESLLHPQFWDMVDYIRATTKHQITTITNGSTLSQRNIDLAASKLDSIKISLDTMDPELAERVGRHYHPRVVDNIKKMVSTGLHVVIMTTDFGQDVKTVAQFVKSLKGRRALHIVQPLQTKDDYASSYTQFEKPIVIYPPTITQAVCGYVHSQSMVMYDVNGLKMPCCFIKDKSQYDGFDAITSMLCDSSNTTIPHACRGCRLLSVNKNITW